MDIFSNKLPAMGGKFIISNMILVMVKWAVTIHMHFKLFKIKYDLNPFCK